MNNNIEADIANIIKPYKDFSETINQHEIANEYMIRRNEPITTRRVRRVIEELIKNGCPIISSPRVGEGGYCWGNRGEEVTECVDRLRRKAAKIFMRARNIKRNYLIEKAKNKSIEQLEIFAK